MDGKFKTLNLLVNQQLLISQFEENLKETLSLLSANENVNSERKKSLSKSKLKTEILDESKIDEETSIEVKLQNSLKLNEELKKRIYELSQEKNSMQIQIERLQKKLKKKDEQMQNMQCKVQEIESSFQKVEDIYKMQNIKVYKGMLEAEKENNYSKESSGKKSMPNTSRKLVPKYPPPLSTAPNLKKSPKVPSKHANSLRNNNNSTSAKVDLPKRRVSRDTINRLSTPKPSSNYSTKKERKEKVEDLKSSKVAAKPPQLAPKKISSTLYTPKKPSISKKSLKKFDLFKFSQENKENANPNYSSASLSKPKADSILIENMELI